MLASTAPNHRVVIRSPQGMLLSSNIPRAAAAGKPVGLGGVGRAKAFDLGARFGALEVLAAATGSPGGGGGAPSGTPIGKGAQATLHSLLQNEKENISPQGVLYGAALLGTAAHTRAPRAHRALSGVSGAERGAGAVCGATGLPAKRAGAGAGGAACVCGQADGGSVAPVAATRLGLGMMLGISPKKGASGSGSSSGAGAGGDRDRPAAKKKFTSVYR